MSKNWNETCFTKYVNKSYLIRVLFKEIWSHCRGVILLLEVDEAFLLYLDTLCWFLISPVKNTENFVINSAMKLSAFAEKTGISCKWYNLKWKHVNKESVQKIEVVLLAQISLDWIRAWYHIFEVPFESIFLLKLFRHFSRHCRPHSGRICIGIDLNHIYSIVNWLKRNQLLI